MHPLEIISLEQLRALRAAGYAIVHRDPPPAMWKAGASATEGNLGWHVDQHGCWHRMVAESIRLQNSENPTPVDQAEPYMRELARCDGMEISDDALEEMRAICLEHVPLDSHRWQPMDTAPKGPDDHIIILFDSAGVHVVRLCWWNDGGELANGGDPDPAAVGWWSYKHSVTQEQIDWMTPVAWMPKPFWPNSQAIEPHA